MQRISGLNMWTCICITGVMFHLDTLGYFILPDGRAHPPSRLVGMRRLPVLSVLWAGLCSAAHWFLEDGWFHYNFGIFGEKNPGKSAAFLGHFYLWEVKAQIIWIGINLDKISRESVMISTSACPQTTAGGTRGTSSCLRLCWQERSFVDRYFYGCLSRITYAKHTSKLEGRFWAGVVYPHTHTQLVPSLSLLNIFFQSVLSHPVTCAVANPQNIICGLYPFWSQWKKGSKMGSVTFYRYNSH